MTVTVSRVGDGPIVYPGMSVSIGDNIQGPSLIKAPEWVKDRLGRYYLYFADHKGSYIRMAYADDLEGPWQIHEPGSLKLAETEFLQTAPKLTPEQVAQVQANFKARGARISHDVVSEVTAPHIASPDVHVDDKNQQVIMYYHGLEGVGHQVTRAAISNDGIRFRSNSEVLGRTYWRSFQHGGHYYALAMPGQVYRSSEPLTGYKKGPLLFNANMRHNAVLVLGDVLHVFWTQVGDVPEHVKHSTVDLSADWQRWKVEGDVEVLRPEFAWEGAEAPLEPSVRSTAYGVVNQLRDPAIFIDTDGEGAPIYLLYAIGGEAGVALARVEIGP